MTRPFRRPSSKRVFPLLSLAMLGLSACGPQFHVAPSDPAALQIEYTGGKKDDGRLYTAATSSDDLKQLKEKVDLNKGKNAALSKAITTLDLRIDERKGKAPAILRVSIGLDGFESTRRLSFETPYEPANGGDFTILNVVAKETPEFRLNLVCPLKDCGKAVLLLRQFEKKKKGQMDDSAPLAEAAMIRRVREIHIKTVTPESADLKNAGSLLLKLNTMFEKPTARTMIATEIAWGRSVFQLELSAEDNLCARGELLQTNEEDTSLESECKPTTLRMPWSRTLTMHLVGNSNRGDFVISAADSGAAIFLLVSEKADGVFTHDPTVEEEDLDPASLDTPIDNNNQDIGDASDADADAEPPVAKLKPIAPPKPVAQPKPEVNPKPAPVVKPAPVFPASPPRPAQEDTQPVQAPSTEHLRASDAFIRVDLQHPATATWERDRDRKEVKAVTEKWKQRGPRELMQNFLNLSAPRLGEIVPQLTKNQVPAEMMFIMIIESKYFADDDHPIQISSTGAVGPWQFLPSTAKWLGLKVLPLIRGKQGRQANPCDERANLTIASDAAGRYFRHLFDLFPADPRLAVMSYNWGQRNVARAVQRTRRIKEIQQTGLDFWTVRRLNMAPKQYTDYVINFLGAQFVGRDPQRYGLVLPPVGSIAPAPRAACR